MVQKHHRVWSLMMAVILLCSCVLSPLSIRASATTQDDHTASQAGDIPQEPSGEPAAETGEAPTEEPEPDPTQATEATLAEETQAAPGADSEATPPEEAAEETEEAAEEIAEETPLSLEPDYTGYPLIPGMQAHMISKPGSQYKTVTPSLSFFSYLDLELFEGAEIHHINVYANRISAADDNQYMTVSVVDSATAAVVSEHRFYARAEALADFTTGRTLSLYPAEGDIVTVAKGQTLGFGKNGDPLVCDFQNDNNVPAALKGFYMSRGFTSGTSGGCLCVDVYAREAPRTSDRDTTLVQALAGKTLSILGDDNSTYSGVSNSTAVNNTLGSNGAWYADGKLPFSQLQTWWRQAADRYGMELLVNNSWSGSTVATKSGNAAASFGWGSRSGNLHDNTGTVVNPDIIAIYMGANDLKNNLACDPAALTEDFFARIEAADYAPAQVTDLTEAAALMVYRVRQNYPNGDIFLFNAPAMSSGGSCREAYNQILDLLAQRYNCTVVDLQGSALGSYSAYTSDGSHPNSAGMDVITDAFADALHRRYVDHTEHTPVILPAVAPTFLTTGLTEGQKCSQCGLILVPQEVVPMLDFVPRMFRWELNDDGTALVNGDGELLTDNDLILESGSISGGTFTNVQLALSEPLELRPDKNWSIEWRASGKWAENSLLFSTQKVNTAAGNIFIYRPSAFVALGTYTGSFQNYTVSLSGYNTTAEHTYRLANRVSDDDSNMVYLYVDGTEIGPLNQHYVANSNQNATSDWAGGQTFQFRYIGAQGHLVKGSGLKYLLVNEGIDHTTHTEKVLPAREPTLTETGLTEGLQCSQCGEVLIAQQVVPALREVVLESALTGKKLSILGDDSSTFQGYSNSTAANDTLGSNAVWYTTGKLSSVNDTWWQQAASRYGMQILVNNSWSGATVTGGSEDASSGWGERTENLHDNTLTNNTGNAPIDPDIIAIYMGAGDLQGGVPCGTALDAAFFARVEAEGFAPASADNFEEAAALMVYKVVSRYPNAEVFLFNTPATGSGSAALREAYNSVFRQIAAHYGCTLVDLHGSALSDYAAHTLDGIHPNAAGMDAITEAFGDALYDRFIASPEAPSAATEKGVYLSDLNYIPSGTSVGSGGYKKDNSPSGSQIQLRVDGATVTFSKGIGAHAPSTITFNIARYREEFPRLCAKLGVDARQGAKGNVQFHILGSNTLTGYNDNTGWTVLFTSEPLTAASAAVSVDLDVSGYNYIRLYADHLGATGNDHSVYADARLVTADYNIDSEYFPRLHPVAWYDQQLSQYSYAHNLEHNLKLIQEREFVSRVGLTVIQSCAQNSDTMADTLTWLLEDSDALQLFIETGNLTAPANTLKALDALYTSYKDLLSDEGDGYVYKKMLIALAITWANDRTLTPYSFGGGVLGSTAWHFDVTDRFLAAKWIYDEGELMYGKEMYASYNMELMRMLVGDYIDLDEVQWVQHYGAKKYPNNPAYRTGPYRFMGYVHPPFYAREEYFSEETWPSYDLKYDLTQYNITRTEWDNNLYRMWMVYEAGGICWNISRIGTTLNKSYGIPSVGTFQPGHEAYFTYSENEEGMGLWSIGNNVGGWSCVYNFWSGVTTRMPMNWGSHSSAKNNSTYILLAQGALNQYGNWQRSMYLNLLADAYASPEEKLEIYRASLNTLDLNLDSYLDIIDLYKSLGSEITESQWLELALEVIDAYTYYPVAMVDLVNIIEPYCGNYGTTLIAAKTKALEKARVATAEESLQYSACITLANAMLGRESDDVLATFSFDGEHAGAIVLGETYEQYAFELQYSLDGGETWYNYIKDVDSSRVIPLTPDQIAAINAEDDILMYISGMDVNGEEPDYFTIDILAGAAPVVGVDNAATQINIHDGENWIVGDIVALEYSLDGGSTWTAYDQETDRFPGNQTIQVRYAPHGTSLLSPAITLTFTDTNERAEFQHIPVSQVSLVRDNGTAYYQGRKGELALDANTFTGWHSADKQLEEDKQIVVVFEEPRQLSGITYQSNGLNGRWTGVEVYVSMDDSTWTWVGSVSGWPSNTAVKTLVLEKSVPAKYVRLQATTVNGFISANDIDFFEDTTSQVSAVSIHYSTTAPTRSDVTASLILTEGFTAQSESSHVFTNNGEHTFIYTDAEGNIFQLTATVTWIDREAPTATVNYSTREITSQPVTVTITPSEAVTVTNGDGTLTHSFTENGKFTFQIVDAAGNTAEIPVTVDWIRPVGKAATFSFDGPNGESLVLDSYYAHRAVTVTYSLDGGSTSQTLELAAEAEKVIPLTAEQLTGLSNIPDSDGEIRVTVTAAGVEEETALIDLLAGPAAPTLGNSNSSAQIAMHDGENWILGKIAELEYSTDGIHWTDYTAGYRFEGDQTVQLRYTGKGLTLPGSVRTLTFTDNAPDFTYIGVGKVKLVSASGGQYYTNYLNFVHKGEYALDGDPFTSWHSASGAPREIIVEFDETRQFAGIVYSGAGGRNGRIRDVEVWVSLNGEDWILAGSASDWPHSESRKELKLAESVCARFVKLVATKTHGNQSFEADRYISTDTLDFYEDTTKPPTDATQIHYSTTSPTNGDVTASLILAPGCRAENLVWTFTENGTREFPYLDAQGQPQSITAKVDWIDKTAPTALVTYSTTEITGGPVTASIAPDEAVTITNNGGSPIYTFTANGSFTFQMVDAVGNTGSVTAAVDWIIPQDGELVTFSFSGEDAGKLVLVPFFAHREVTVEYQVYDSEPRQVALSAEADKRISLTREELDALYSGPDQSAELRVTIQAAFLEGYSKTQSINILNGAAPTLMNSGSPNASAQIAAQDEENHITGKVTGLEYSLDGQSWTDYVHGVTRFPGDQVVQVRYRAHDLTRPSGSVTLTFTEGNTPAFTYISASRVSLVSASNGQYYQNNKGEYALDGDPFTFWHSAQNSPKEFSVQFDRVVNFSGFRYTLLDSSRNGRFLDVEVYTSLDGQTWEQAGGVTGWTWNAYPAVNAPKTLVLEQPVKAQYVKLVATSTTGAFASARDIGFYEDTTSYVANAVAVTEYLRLDGHSLWLVTQSGKLEAGKIATYDGEPMFYSEKYGSYCYLVTASSLTQEAAAAKIGIADGTAGTVALDATDVNGSGLVDASDAQFVYNMYNGRYDGFTEGIPMERFLLADVNCDGKVNTEDAAAIIASILQNQ